MGCNPRSKTYGPANVHTKKDGTTWNGFTLSPPEDAIDVKNARGAIEVRNSSGAIKARLVYRYSNDGITWGSWIPLYSNGTEEQTNDGLRYVDTWTDVTSGAKRYIQWGAEVLQSAGSALEAAIASISIDTKAW